MGGVSDPRWTRLLEDGARCSSCGEIHHGIMDMGYLAPYYWQGDAARVEASAITDHNNFLTHDLCAVDGEFYFVRCLLNLRIVDAEGQKFAYGVWASLSKQNFQTYRDHFDNGDQGKFGPWFGWFSTKLMGYPDTLSMKCQVHLQDERRRPHIELEPTDHPLAIEQRDGITIQRLFDIYKVHGHDFGEARASH